jgi:large conductance mechanosensitive channel
VVLLVDLDTSDIEGHGPVDKSNAVVMAGALRAAPAANAELERSSDDEEDGVRGMWSEFKAFALGGNMLDLALGFIIGTAFATVVDSLAGDVIMQLVAAAFGQPDFSGLVWTLNGAQIRYGAFLTQLLNFLLLGLVLFALVKVLKRIGLGNFRAQGSHECPYCKEFVPIDALKCKWCTADIEPGQAEDEDIKLIADRQRTAE